jgi:hypothetical protein
MSVRLLEVTLNVTVGQLEVGNNNGHHTGATEVKLDIRVVQMK